MTTLTNPPTFGVCTCGHGEHAHNDLKTKTECSLASCDCRVYDEWERYSLQLVKVPADPGGRP
jgi:hypothetical protein